MAGGNGGEGQEWGAFWERYKGALEKIREKVKGPAEMAYPL